MHVDINRICVPTDFSEAADHAVHYGAALAHRHGAALHLLHVLENAEGLTHHPDFTRHGEIARAYFNRLEKEEEAEANDAPPPEYEEEPLATHEFLKTLEMGIGERFDGTRRNWWDNLELFRDVRYGHPVEEICHYAEKKFIDLIVIGTHGRSGLARILLGSVTERVLRISPCPVLTVRHPDHSYTLIDP